MQFYVCPVHLEVKALEPCCPEASIATSNDDVVDLLLEQANQCDENDDYMAAIMRRAATLLSKEVGQ